MNENKLNVAVDNLCKIAETVAPVRRTRLAAAIYHKKKLVSIGVNEWKTHPLQAHYNVHDGSAPIHAEMSAIVRALKTLPVSDLRECELVVVRLLRNDQRALSKPCAACSAAIKAFGIKAVYFTTNNDTVEKL